MALNPLDWKWKKAHTSRNIDYYFQILPKIEIDHFMEMQKQQYTFVAGVVREVEDVAIIPREEKLAAKDYAVLYFTYIKYEPPSKKSTLDRFIEAVY